MKSKTELCEIFEAKDDPDFTRSFRRDFFICVGIGFLATIGMISVIVNAENIDAFFTQLLKDIFI